MATELHHFHWTKEMQTLCCYPQGHHCLIASDLYHWGHIEMSFQLLLQCLMQLLHNCLRSLHLCFLQSGRQRLMWFLLQHFWLHHQCSLWLLLQHFMWLSL
ncbi:hypothetical protein NQZ68_031064 [Dissostichus eleginoides]|nr:hypothetical protein NQZ68_031064 [Dissostichus eleginoides]